MIIMIQSYFIMILNNCSIIQKISKPKQNTTATVQPNDEIKISEKYYYYSTCNIFRAFLLSRYVMS